MWAFLLIYLFLFVAFLKGKVSRTVSLLLSVLRPCLDIIPKEPLRKLYRIGLQFTLWTLIGTDRHWSALICIDRHWSALIGTDRHWSACFVRTTNRFLIVSSVRLKFLYGFLVVNKQMISVEMRVHRSVLVPQEFSSFLGVECSHTSPATPCPILNWLPGYQPPTRMLHFFNAPPNCTVEQLKEVCHHIDHILYCHTHNNNNANTNNIYCRYFYRRTNVSR